MLNLRCRISLKLILIISFVILMAVSGLLTFFLTYISFSRNVTDLAEVTMKEVSYALTFSVLSKIMEGHLMNRLEGLYFLNHNLTLNNFITVHYIWKYLTVQNLLSQMGTYIGSIVSFLPEGTLAVSPNIGALYVNLNRTVCNDTEFFPGSNCSVPNYEFYPMDPGTSEVKFSTPYLLKPFIVTDQVGWLHGALSRTKGWRSTPSDLFSPGYTPVLNSPTIPTLLTIQLTSAVLDSQGYCVGSLSKVVRLDYVNDLMQYLVQVTPVLTSNGRAFIYEQDGLAFIGASHGIFYVQEVCPSCDFGIGITRFHPYESNDPVIAMAGQVILNTYQRTGAIPGTFTFNAIEHTYLHSSTPLVDQYGLKWMISILLSMTDLTRKVKYDSFNTLWLSIVLVVASSIVTGLGITFALLRPLSKLSQDMSKVRAMMLSDINPKQSILSEIAVMQKYFMEMVFQLSEYRAFLPYAILMDDEGSDSLNDSTGALASRQSFRNFASSHLPPVASLGVADHLKPASSGPLPGRIPSSGSVSEHGNNSPVLPAVNVPDGRRKSVANIAAMQLGTLTRRIISCLQVDITGFHKLMDDDTLSDIHSDLVERITQVVQQNHGICNPVLGDKVLAAWNVKSQKAEHSFHCATTALLLNTAIRQWRSGQNNTIEARISCSSGMAVFGPMGTKSSRTFTTLSACIPRGFALQKLAKFIPFGVVCDGWIHEQISFRYNTRLVGILGAPLPQTPFTPKAGTGCGNGKEKATVSPPLAAVGCIGSTDVITPSSSTSLLASSTHKERFNPGDRVYEIMGTANVVSDEWMYELKEQESKVACYAEFEAGIRALFGRNESAATQLLRSYSFAHSEDSLAQWYASHCEDLVGMHHPAYGLLVPLSLFHQS